MAVDNRGRKLPRNISFNGKLYEARFMIDGIRYFANGKTLSECQKKMEQEKVKIRSGLYQDKNKITLNEWFNTWIETYKKNNVKYSTYASYKLIYKKHIKTRILGRTQLPKIRAEHIQALYNELSDLGLAHSTISHVKVVLHGALEQAYKNGIVERNVVKMATMPKKKPPKERIAMTKEEQRRFMLTAVESWYFNLFALMLRTGMRIGEMQGLKYSDINYKDNVIQVRRTLQYDAEVGFYEEDPKTEASRRDIPMTDDIIKIIKNQKEDCASDIININQYIFTTYDGQPLTRDNVRSEIESIVKEIRKDEPDYPHITPHTFRHTFATRAIEAGMEPQVLKTILGHSSLAMTMDLYSHVLPDTKADAMSKIAGAF